MATTVQTVLTVASTATTSGALVAGQHKPVDATSGALTMTLPTPTTIGARLRVEKVDTSANAVIISGTIRGASGTVSLYGKGETIGLVAETLTSWRPDSDHKPKSWLDATYVQTTGTAKKLVVDPAPGYVAATGEVVLTTAPDGVPAGGSVGQALVKSGGADYATGWGTAGLSQSAIMDLIGSVMVDKTAPAAPASLTAVAGASSLTLSWPATPDSDLYRYEVRVDTSTPPSSAWVAVARGALTAVRSGLTTTPYYGQVRSVDFSGNYSAATSLASPVTPTAANVIFSTDFTGTDGTTAITGITSYLKAGASASLLSNRLDLKTPSGYYGWTGRTYVTGASASADIDMTFDYAFTTLGIQTLQVGFRHSDNADSGGDIKPYYGYFVGISTTAVSLQKSIGNTVTNLSGNVATAAVAGVLCRVRFKAFGNAMMLKVWDPATTEPSTWSWSGTDSAFSQSSQAYFCVAANATNNIGEMTIDNITMITPA